MIAENPFKIPELNADKIAPAFSRIYAQYVGFQVVMMPPTWKEQEPIFFTFVIFEEELRREELHLFFNVSVGLGLINPRPISRKLLELASIFHPLFYSSFISGHGRPCAQGDIDAFNSRLTPCHLRISMHSSLNAASTFYYMQSMLFLAGCTLSAAIIQSRFSQGTIESKLNRLWQAAQYARRLGYAQFNDLGMENFVVECGRRIDTAPIARLIEIKKAYGRALNSLSQSIPFKSFTVKQEHLSQGDKSRFGFVHDLRESLGRNLQCVLVYGSSVTSIDFHDYDLVVVVKNAAQALEHLSGTKPSYQGKEINLSIYDSEDFISFQAMSGDNLDHNARCIFGETEIPVKPPLDLMVRNFSFAYIRLRQLLGMAGYLAKQKLHGGLQDQTNLYDYFVKIPMHIMKGVRSVANEPISKEYINAWTSESLGYDLNDQLSLLRTRRFSDAISNAYVATHGVITYLNQRYKVFESS